METAKRAINPLHDLNKHQNSLIASAINSNDWSTYDNFQAKQHPAWYDLKGGVLTENKTYWGNLIESRMSALKEAKAEGDQDAVESWKERVNESIEEFKQAPGVTPYVLGLNSNAGHAAEYGVEEPTNEWFDSKWNNPTVASDGRFEQNEWYANPYMKENPDLAQKAIAAAKAYREPEIAKVATSIEKEMNAYYAKEGITQDIAVKDKQVNVKQTTPVQKAETSQPTSKSSAYLEESLQNSLIRNTFASVSQMSADMVQALYKRA
ncbi:hypothetical protein [Pontibacillus chungwhensis]|uniref:Uncharacterized protein n=2 Tax=Pontibacillus TaxID=289201 RepID=A0ABY8UWV4_9BACI|nr:hypothetical protein [Pontibacillus chungwhensis]WIF97835.1 hypothetical protein QNI29_19240 [Pontibacillus chungwhensis]